MVTTNKCPEYHHIKVLVSKVIIKQSKADILQLEITEAARQYREVCYSEANSILYPDNDLDSLVYEISCDFVYIQKLGLKDNRW